MLADYLAIPVQSLSTLRAVAPSAVRFFVGPGETLFSGVTVFEGWRRMIIYNDRHDEGRQQSDIAHELAHGLLLHEPAPALDDSGERRWDGEAELEANWLAGAMLISDEAAMRIARLGWSEAQAAAQYGVSPAMVRFRLNVTAAGRRIARAEQESAVAVPARRGR